MVTGATLGFAQGSVNFFTFNSGNTSLGQCFLPPELGSGPVSSTFVGQLWWSDTSNGIFQSVGSPTAFSAGSPGYVNSGTVSVPGRDNGTTVWFSMYVWDGPASTYPGNQAATAYGQTQVRSRILGGGFDSDANFWPQQQFNTFANLTLTAVPEPSVIALAGLGVASLLLFRRRK